MFVPALSTELLLDVLKPNTRGATRGKRGYGRQRASHRYGHLPGIDNASIDLAVVIALAPIAYRECGCSRTGLYNRIRVGSPVTRVELPVLHSLGQCAGVG